MSLKNDKLKILKEAKLHASKNGWNNNLFITIEKFSKFKYHEIRALFPNGCLDLIEMYLEEINEKMTLQSQKINLRHKISDLQLNCLQFQVLGATRFMSQIVLKDEKMAELCQVKMSLILEKSSIRCDKAFHKEKKRENKAVILK